MAFFNTKSKPTSFALIEINSSSVGAALAHIDKENGALVYYSTRQLIEAKEHETPSEAMLRTANEVGKALTVLGAPTLHKETGSGHVDSIVVSIGAPWQKTKVRIETLSEKKPFLFTKALVSELLAKETAAPKGYMKSNESVLATLLNGYETTRPYGRRVSRAEVVVLSSLIEESTADVIEKMLREKYHTHSLTLHALATITYEGLRELYPHEKDFIVLEVSGSATDISFIKRGLLVDVVTIPNGTDDMVNEVMQTPKADARDTKDSWLEKVVLAFQESSSKQALPHTVFLLAEPVSLGYIQKLLDSRSLHALWLTDDPLRIIPVLPSHFTKMVRVKESATADVFLALLALYSKRQM